MTCSQHRPRSISVTRQCVYNQPTNTYFIPPMDCPGLIKFLSHVKFQDMYAFLMWIAYWYIYIGRSTNLPPLYNFKIFFKHNILGRNLDYFVFVLLIPFHWLNEICLFTFLGPNPPCVIPTCTCMGAHHNRVVHVNRVLMRIFAYFLRIWKYI